MSYQQILYEATGPVATITLNRPAKLNAYSEVLVHEVIAALGDARDDDSIRAVIFTGAGRGFCAGGDVSRDFQYPDGTAATAWSRCWRCARTCMNWSDCCSVSINLRLPRSMDRRLPAG